MKKIILLVVLALAGVAAWYFWETRPKPDQEVSLTGPIKASQHSSAFISSIDSMLNTYYLLSESLVAWDSAAANQHSRNLQTSVANLDLAELQKDSLIFSAASATVTTLKQQATALTNAQGLEQKRRAFHTLSQNLYDFLRTVQYNEHTVYLQECPMAFNDEETGNWLSKTEEIRNPFLGLHHPKYKSGMLECGETKDSLRFAQVK